MSTPRRSLQVLRDTLNCTLPVEIIYNGPGEMDDWAINKFQACWLRPLMWMRRSNVIHESWQTVLAYLSILTSCSFPWLSATEIFP